MTYVVLLRGINVGGVKMPMAELRLDLTSLGFTNVKTYLASGNVSLSSKQSLSDVKEKIESMLKLNYGYMYEIFIYEDISAVVGNYPFKSKPNTHRYVIFCRNNQICGKLASEIDRLSLQGENTQKSQNLIFWSVTIGRTLDSEVGKLISKAMYRNDVTTRNLQTLEKIKSYINTS